MKIPIIEHIYKRISIQNTLIEMEFQAITSDQAYTMLIYAVIGQKPETILNVAFKFIDDRNLMQAHTHTHTIERSI